MSSSNVVSKKCKGCLVLCFCAVMGTAQLQGCCRNRRPSTLVLGSLSCAYSKLPVAAVGAALCLGAFWPGWRLGVLAPSCHWSLAGGIAAEWLVGLH